MTTATRRNRSRRNSSFFEQRQPGKQSEKSAMNYENILFEKKDGIAKVTFNRPKVLNALNRKTVEELQSALLDARDDASVRVVILTGCGAEACVAWADIAELWR